MRTKILIAFLIAFTSLFLFPNWRLLTFVPYLILTFYAYPRIGVLWHALGCGALIDLFSSSPLFGLTSLSYVFTSFLLYRQKQNFFEDKLSTLPIMTFLFSTLETAVHAGLLVFFGEGQKLSWEWAYTDLLIMPLCDALYALLAFAIPFQITAKLSKLIRYAPFWKSRRR